MPDAQLAEIRKRVAARQAPSISGLIQHAVQKSLDNAAAYNAMLDQALLETGGPLTAKERAWARKMLSPQKKGAKARRAA